MSVTSLPPNAFHSTHAEEGACRSQAPSCAVDAKVADFSDRREGLADRAVGGLAVTCRGVDGIAVAGDDLLAVLHGLVNQAHHLLVGRRTLRPGEVLWGGVDGVDRFLPQRFQFLAEAHVPRG